MGDLNSREVREAAQQALEGWERWRSRTPASKVAVQAGDLMVFDGQEHSGVEWLVIQPHPDDAGLWLVVPVDEFPLCGTPDVTLSVHEVFSPLQARCGQGTWVPAGQLQSAWRSGALDEPEVRMVRKRLADLARGHIQTSERQAQVDGNFEYEEWLAEVEQLRLALESPGDSGSTVRRSWSAGLPAHLDSALPILMAAEDGPGLARDVEKLLGEIARDVRHLLIDLRPRGSLTLLTLDKQLWAIWKGEGAERPPVVRVRSGAEDWRGLTFTEVPGEGSFAGPAAVVATPLWVAVDALQVEMAD